MIKRVDGKIWIAQLGETKVIGVEEVPRCPICGKPCNFDPDQNPIPGE